MFNYFGVSKHLHYPIVIIDKYELDWYTNYFHILGLTLVFLITFGLAGLFFFDFSTGLNRSP